MEKRCPDCRISKPAGDFGKNKRTSDGLANYCKICTSQRNRVQYLANQERRKAEARAYRAALGPEIRDRERERWLRRKDAMAEYRAANRPMINQTRAAWILKNPDYLKRWRQQHPDHQKAWRAANWDRILEMERARRIADPESFAARKHAYRSRRVSAPHVPYTAEQLRGKFEYYGRRCWICRKPLLPGFNWDHVKPLNKGGPDMLSNLRPACGSCNKAKRDRWPFKR